MINAYQLERAAEPAKATAAVSGSGGKKKASSPVPLGNLQLEVVRLFSIQHDAKVNAVAAVFDSEDSATAKNNNCDGTEKATEEAASGEKGSQESHKAEASESSADSTLRYTGNCKVYVADISNDITLYATAP